MIKKLFYIGISGLALFEILNVYFIMPMPGSQRMNSLDVAYFLYSYRWIFRIFFGLLIVIGSVNAFQIRRRWVPLLLLLVVFFVVYYFNFKMAADQMFKQPEHITFKAKNESIINDSSIVVGVELNGNVKAYPIRFISYHHQVQDVIGGKEVIVTYCNVCRTGRVFEPVVKGHQEKFRLVGMDHFNAMIEDETTKTWWRQANGEAVIGSLKGERLPEVESIQLTLAKLFELYPHALVMQPDDAALAQYDSLAKFERGKSKGKLTRTDSLSWKDKSWVVGIEIDQVSKAYDWNQLKRQRIINDKIGDKPIALVLSIDEQSFVVFERPVEEETFSIRHDTIFAKKSAYDFSGRELRNTSQQLKKVKAYQEFWHSWRTFHPDTQIFQ